MPQSLSHVIIHTVFSTKNRLPFFKEPEIREEVFSFLGGCINTVGCQSLTVGGYEDHVHLLSTLSRSLSQAEFVKEVKRNSSIWVKENFGTTEFSWQKGYGIFSVSESKIPVVRRYIQNQDDHHREVSFQDEFRKMLQAHNMSFDEKYVWD